MLLLVFVFACLLGFIGGFCLCLWWHLEEDKERCNAGISTLPNDFEDFVPETSDWFQLLGQFFFQRTRNKAFINEYACTQLRKEVSAVLSKINGIKRFEVRDFSLGEAPPLLDCFQVVKIKKSAEADGEIEELALQTNFTYFNGVSFVLSVSHVLGVADLSVAISQLSGPAIFGFLTCPCEYWYFSFKEEPTIDLKVKVRGQLLPFKHKIELLVSNGIRKGIKKMHVLPAIKPRFKPFFSSDITLEQLTKIKDERFRPNFTVDFSKEEVANGPDTGFQKTSLEVTVGRLSNLSLMFEAVRVEKVFVTLSVDYKPLVPYTVVTSSEDPSLSSVGRKVIVEFLNFSYDKSTFKESFTFVETKQVENGTICYRLKVASVSSLNQNGSAGTSEQETLSSIDANNDAGMNLKAGDVLLSIDGVDIVSKHFNEVNQLMDAQVDAVVSDILCVSTTDVLKIFAKRENLGIRRNTSEPLVKSRGHQKSRRVDKRNSEPQPVIHNTPKDILEPGSLMEQDKQCEEKTSASAQDDSKTTSIQNDDHAISSDEQRLDGIVPIRVASIRRHSADSAISFVVDENETLEKQDTGVSVLSASSIDVSKVETIENETHEVNTDELFVDKSRKREKDTEEIDGIKKASNQVSQARSVSMNVGSPDPKSVELELRESRSVSATEARTEQTRDKRTTLDRTEYTASSAPLDEILDFQQSSNQQSGLFSASHIINCCNSFIRNTFSFEVQPCKTEFLNMTVWGVDAGSRCHYPLANLSVPVGHILNLCSITSNLSVAKTFYLSQSVLAFAAPANTSSLQLHNMSEDSKERLLTRCYGSVRCQFKVQRSVASSQSSISRRVKPHHQNEKPPLSIISSVNSPDRSQVNPPAVAQRQGRRYFPHLRGPKSTVPSPSTGSSTKTVAIGLADKLRPRIQHDSKIVATAMKSSLNALQSHSNAQFNDAQSRISSDFTGTSNSIENYPAIAEDMNRNSAGRQSLHGGGAKLAGRIVQMKGNVKKMSSDFLKEQSVKITQQKITSKAKPFRQLFNRNKGSTAPPRNSNQPVDIRVEDFAMVNTEDLLASMESSISVGVSEHPTTSALPSSALEFLDYDEELDSGILNDEELKNTQDTDLLFHTPNSHLFAQSEEEFTRRLDDDVCLMELNEDIEQNKVVHVVDDDAIGYFDGDLDHDDASDEFNMDDAPNLAHHSDDFETLLQDNAAIVFSEENEIETVFRRRFTNDELTRDQNEMDDNV